MEFLKYLLRLTMNVYDEKKRVWVYSDVTSGRCAALEKNYIIEEYDCYYVMHPFLCEKGKLTCNVGEKATQSEKYLELC